MWKRESNGSVFPFGQVGPNVCGESSGGEGMGGRWRGAEPTLSQIQLPASSQINQILRKNTENIGGESTFHLDEPAFSVSLCSVL